MLGHQLGAMMGGDTLHVYLGDHLARITIPAPALRTEGLVSSSGLGKGDGHPSAVTTTRLCDSMAMFSDPRNSGGSRQGPRHLRPRHT